MSVLENLFTDIADAIRDKTGETDAIRPIDFPEKIAGIKENSIELLENVLIQPDFSNGNQSFSAPDEMAVKSAIIQKPETLIPENIKRGQSVAGVVGNFAGDFAGDIVNKTVALDFRDKTTVNSPAEMATILSDSGNYGKVVLYQGDAGEYIPGKYYKMVDRYEAFDPYDCSEATAEIASGTELTTSIDCNVGDLIIAAFVIRSGLVSLSDGWTLISTSQSVTEVNTTATYFHTLSFAYKYAEATTENITVTQETAGRIYINMVSFSNASGFEDMGFQTHSTIGIPQYSTFTRPEGKIILWGVTKSTWATSNYPVWSVSNGSRLIQLGSSTASRLLLAIDTSNDTSVKFTTNGTSTADAYICGALSIQMVDDYCFVESDESECGFVDSMAIDADKDTVMERVTVLKPATLIPENIALGVNIGGVFGKSTKYAMGTCKGVSGSAQMITHNLGAVPDLILAVVATDALYGQNWEWLDIFHMSDALKTKTGVTRAVGAREWGINSKINGTYRWASTTSGFETAGNTWIHEVTATTFKLPSGFAASNTILWFAFAGLT